MLSVIKRRRFLYSFSFIAVARFPTFLELTFSHSPHLTLFGKVTRSVKKNLTLKSNRKL